MPFWKYPHFNTLTSIDNPLVRSNWRREKVGETHQGQSGGQTQQVSLLVRKTQQASKSVGRIKPQQVNIWVGKNLSK
jgi:hypothetical protein